MDNLTQIIENIKQAPWRVQRQWIGILLVCVVVGSMVAGMYINITAQAAIRGRQIQLITNEMEGNRQENADMETQLAKLTSSDAMQERAGQLGFYPASNEEIIYLSVIGYTERLAVDLSTSNSPELSFPLIIEYKETLFDWLTQQIIFPRGGQ